jgi:hypothetical protein
LRPDVRCPAARRESKTATKYGQSLSYRISAEGN